MEASTKNEFAVRIGVSNYERRRLCPIPQRDIRCGNESRKLPFSETRTSCRGRRRNCSRAGPPGVREGCLTVNCLGRAGQGFWAQQLNSTGAHGGDAVAAGGGPDKGQVEAATSNDGSTARLRL